MSTKLKGGELQMEWRKYSWEKLSWRKPKLLDTFSYELKGKLKLVLSFFSPSHHNFDIKFSYLYTKEIEISAFALYRLKGHCSRRKKACCTTFHLSSSWTE